MTGKVRGIGGIFIRSKRPKELAAWYQKHLGFPLEAEHEAVFHWQEVAATVPGSTTWAVLGNDSNLMRNSEVEYMVNFCVEDLSSLVDKLREGGITIEMEPQSNQYGSFAWIRDLDNKRIELWEPPEQYPPSESITDEKDSK